MKDINTWLIYTTLHRDKFCAYLVFTPIKPYLPPQPSQFKVLITTRLKLDLAGSLFLSVLQNSDALLLLAQLIGEEKIKQESVQAEELCRRLGNLPLALQLVGRYVNKRKITLTELLRRLEEKGLGHPSLVVNENDPTWTLNVKHGVAAAFELSWLELSDNAKQLGCLLMALLYSDQGRYSEAEPLVKKALEIAELSLGVDHPSTATIRKNLKSLGDN